MKGYKTLLAATLITLLGGLQQSGVFQLIPDNYQGLAVAGIGLAMAGLRLVTTSAVGKRY